VLTDFFPKHATYKLANIVNRINLFRGAQDNKYLYPDSSARLTTVHNIAFSVWVVGLSPVSGSIQLDCLPHAEPQPFTFWPVYSSIRPSRWSLTPCGYCQ